MRIKFRLNLLKFTALLLAAHSLSACMYYAEFDRKRAETESIRQRTNSMEAYNTCIKANLATTERCAKPAN